MKNKFLIIFSLLILFISGYCVYGSTLRPHLSPENAVPLTDIVFTSPESLEDVSIVGFVNQDGSNLITRRMYLPQASPFWGDMFVSYSSLIGEKLNWGQDGNSIAFISGQYALQRSIGNPNLVTSRGNFLSCKNVVVYIEVRPINGTTVLITSIPGDLNAQDTIDLFDMSTCKQKQRLYEPESHDEILNVASLSTQGWLAIGISYVGGYGKIKVISPNHQRDYIIENAGGPAWSKDGERLVYRTSAQNRLAISDKNGNILWILPHDGSYPSWSPDGKWIVYSRDHIIFKTNVETGVEYEITKGENPNWRWKKP